MKEIDLKNNRIVTDKLVPFGFEISGQGYSYTEPVMDEFELRLFVDSGGKLFTELIESGVGEYVLHLVPEAQGEFVGKVKAAYNAVLDRFFASCCERNIFASEQSRAVVEYVRGRYRDELEHLWEKFPEDAIVRRKDTKSWYLLLLRISLRKLGINSDEVDLSYTHLTLPPNSRV